MLFDPRPKENIEELFDREKELEGLRQSIKTPLTLLLGVRRIGKTSLLKSFLNSLKKPYIYVDMRLLEEGGYSKASLYRLLSGAVSKATSRWGEKILGYFRGVRGVSISGFSVEFDWGEKNLTTVDIFSRLNEFALNNIEDGYIVVAFDEAQLLRMMRGGKGRLDFRNILAYCYDNFSGLGFILTGSEVGLLFGFLNLDEPASPLYGRYVNTVTVDRFTEEMSLEFLRRGFEEANMQVKDDNLRAIVEKVDGIVGWLAYYGHACVTAGGVSDTIVKTVTAQALRLVSKELGELFKRSTYYKHVLHAISLGEKRWMSIKKAVEAWSGKMLTNAEITRLLNNLIDLGIVVKTNGVYEITDPLVREYCRTK
jgi:AAA+ ATPase superfamily predicted ATPase